MSNDFIVPFPGNPNVAFEIVRAFPASDKAKEYGIYANFSMKIVLINKKTKMDFASINSLMLKAGDDGAIYVSSKGEKVETSKGDITIYPFSLFPGANSSDGDPRMHDDFVKQIAGAVKAFVKYAQDRQEKRTAAPRTAPPVLQEIAALRQPMMPKQNNNDVKSGEFGDIPV
jgi:hypothetical protein